MLPCSRTWLGQKSWGKIRGVLFPSYILMSLFQGFISIVPMYKPKIEKSRKYHTVFESRHEPLCLCLFHLKYLFVHIDNEHLQLSAENILPLAA